MARRFVPSFILRFIRSLPGMAGLACAIGVASTMAWSAIVMPAPQGPVKEMAKADLDRDFAAMTAAGTAGANAHSVPIATNVASSASAAPDEPAVMTKADFDRTFADAMAAGAGPAYANGVAREVLRRFGRQLLRDAYGAEQH